MYDLPPCSLRMHLNPPFQQNTYVGEIPMHEFGKVIRRFQGKDKPHPETDVLKFYFLNHVFHHISTQHLPDEELHEEVYKLLQARTMTTSNIATRVLGHTFLTTLYELNWLHHPPEKSSGDKFFDDMTSRFGKPISDHFNRVGTGGFTLGVLKDFDQLKVSCGDYVRALYSIYTSSPHLQAIGKDKQWIAIAGVTLEYVSGRSSLEEACDKAFSLFHWGGSIFNKCIYYKENTEQMQHFLDVQDSGQVPQYLNSIHGKKNKFVDNELAEWVRLAKKHFPELMDQPVNTKLIIQAQAKREKGLQNTIQNRNNNYNRRAAQQNADKVPEREIPKIDQIVFGALGIDLTKGMKGP